MHPCRLSPHLALSVAPCLALLHIESTGLADVAAEGLMISLTPPVAPGILRP